MRVSERRLRLGAVLTFGSIGAFFWWGHHFALFGHPIRLNGPFLGFLGCLVIGAFGAGYGASGIKGGLKAAGTFVFLVAGALAVGIALGNYR